VFAPLAAAIRADPSDNRRLRAPSPEPIYQDGPVEVTLTAENGRTLRLGNVVRSGDGSIDYDATLTVPGGSVTTTVHEHGTWLPGFFRDLAGAWMGFDDPKSFGSLEGQLTIYARHDGLGTVFCEVTLRQPWPPEWSLSASLDFGAGAHLEVIAAEIGALLG
jgi:hypothetical protein